jgi:hypothetical protein
MDFADVIITFIYSLTIILLSIVYVKINKNNPNIKRYFLIAIVLRIFGGISFALVYFYYYAGGDTLNYYKDSLIINTLLSDDFFNWLKIYFIDAGAYDNDLYYYTIRMNFYMDDASFFIDKLASIINLFTFKSFIGTTIIFAMIGFMGSWQLFLTINKILPSSTSQVAIACLFLPSIVFWGSGIMKDTICFMALATFFSNIMVALFEKNLKPKVLISIAVSGYVLYILKIYILVCFLPPLFLYVYFILKDYIRSKTLKKIIGPILFAFAISLGIYAAYLITLENVRYSFQNITHTAQITADYIGSVSQISGGSFYSIGKLDFSFATVVQLLPKAIIVTLYRPFLWEVKSPIMLFSALEGVFIFYLTLQYIFSLLFKKGTSNPFVPFAILFSIVFAFAVGVTSNNFGTLARYKIPMLPFLVCAISSASKKNKI